MYSFITNGPFKLENGQELKSLKISYHTYGKLNVDESNVVWVCHALTANSDVFDWWPGLFGEGKTFDPNKYFIVCANALGSCYGSTGPASSKSNREPLLEEFPQLTTRDLANAHDLLRQRLGIRSVKTLIGASLGGQQALEWSIINPSAFQELILIATNARHSAYGIALNESQRQAIYSDPTYGKGNIKGGKAGLSVARQIAMVSYRSYDGYVATQTDEEDRSSDFKASSYQRYQGKKLADRFCAYSYVTLSQAMDSHNVGRNRNGLNQALKNVKARTLIIGIRSDNLFPTNEQRLLHNLIEWADYAEIDSQFGHDGFLIETDQLSVIIEGFISNNLSRFRPTVFKTTTKKSELMNLAINKQAPQNVVV